MNMDLNKYQEMYAQSLNQPEKFWDEQAQRYLSWHKPWDKVMSGGYEQVDFQWFSGGKLNVCYNCVDRHLLTKAEQTAILWQGNDVNQHQAISFKDLHKRVCRFANVLKNMGVQKGDRVCIYLPMIPEAAIAMLACCRIGAIHSIVFAGFSPEALKNRINNAQCCFLITADEGIRGNRTVPLKAQVDKALTEKTPIQSVLVIQHTKADISWQANRDINFTDAVKTVNDDCPIEVMDAEDPLFILYTSGSTGQPKGVLHTTGGYLLYAAMTHQIIFDYQPGDIY